MPTEAQIRANQANAQRSTGPRTDEGKLVASQNSLVHGMRAAQVLLSDEDPALLAALHAGLWRDLQPRGAMEEMLVERIVAAEWRLRRAHLVERGIFERTDERDSANAAKSLAQLVRLKFHEACHSADALGKLSRYENSIERSLHRSLAELRRLQEARGEDMASDEKKLPNEPNSAATLKAATSNAAG